MSEKIRLVGCVLLAAALGAAPTGCLWHRRGPLASLAAAAAATPAAPVYPPIAPEAVQFLTVRPRVPYDELGTITIQPPDAQPAGPSLREIRESAARVGANAVVLREDAIVREKLGLRRRRARVRRTVALLIRRRDVHTPPLPNAAPAPLVPSPNPRLDRGGPPPPSANGPGPGGSGP